MNAPEIKIEFSGTEQVNGEVLGVWVRSLNEAVKAARGDYNALQELSRMVKEASWLIDNYEGEILYPSRTKREEEVRP